MVNGAGGAGGAWAASGRGPPSAGPGDYLPTPVDNGRVRLAVAPFARGPPALSLTLVLTCDAPRSRHHGVVNKFVESAADGLSSLSSRTAATLSNMCPEYGATCSLVAGGTPRTLRYLEVTGRRAGTRWPWWSSTPGPGLFPRPTAAPSRSFSECWNSTFDSIEPSGGRPQAATDRVRVARGLGGASPWLVHPSRISGTGEVARFDAER